jgi:hypothetical protein
MLNFMMASPRLHRFGGKFSGGSNTALLDLDPVSGASLQFRGLGDLIGSGVKIPPMSCAVLRQSRR